ncbi:phage head-tail joining protein [Escherichia coli]|uniref:phage head-tail joining protein n=1 Tax=Escherichia coli TaxID=562 RepID=UPI001F0E68BA|nr:gpW family protein [Escherichia coli]UMR98615.1 phage tail protein [Escherichia coli]
MATMEELAEAKAALHALYIGKRVVTVSRNGRSVTYTSAGLADLKRYIAELEEELGLRVRRGGPLRFVL